MQTKWMMTGTSISNVQNQKLKSTYYICPLLQSPVVKPTQCQKGCHSDDTFCGHPSINTAKHDDVSNPHGVLYMSPVTPNSYL